MGKIKMLGTAVIVSVLLTGCSGTQSTQVEPSEDCNNALLAAANRVDINNDEFLYLSLDACKTAEEWVAAVIKNPNAGILTSYDTKEGKAFLSLICVRAVGTPTCLDAISKGYTDFKLDDPRLPELQKYGTGVPQK